MELKPEDVKAELNQLVETSQKLNQITEHLEEVTKSDDDNIKNISWNIVLPSAIGGLGAVGLNTIGYKIAPEGLELKSAQKEPDYIPNINMGIGAEFTIHAIIIVLIATLIGSLGILTLIGLPSKQIRAKAWQVGLVYALLFPLSITALIQNHFLIEETDRKEQEIKNLEKVGDKLEKATTILVLYQEKLEQGNEILPNENVPNSVKEKFIRSSKEAISESEEDIKSLKELQSQP